jgi:hypothetical protein
VEKYKELVGEFLAEYHVYHYIKLSKYWILFGDEDDIPSKGFKIHLSSNEFIYIETLKKVVPVLHKYNLIWKIPNSDNVAQYILSTENSENINGKLITIYPKNYKEFESVIKVLENLEILNRDCIDIKTDKRYKDSCIFFREYS